MKSILGAFLALLSISVNASFEQAYTPIRVGNITIFVPIELVPDKVAYLSVNHRSNDVSLAWSKVDDAQYYQIQHSINGQWVFISENYTKTHYLAGASSGQFRVRACHQYDCGDWQSQIRSVQEPLNIQAFFSNSARSNESGQLSIGWSVKGASSVTLTQKVAGSVVSSKSGLHPVQGMTTTPIHGLTEFTLNVYGFDGEVIRKSLLATSKPKFPIQLQGHKGHYRQPLYESSLDIVENSIVEHDDNLFFATHDGLLFFYQGLRSSDGEVQWRHGWNIQLDGVVNNAPIVENDFLYFTESHFDNTGRVCHVRWLDGSAKVCTNTTQSNLLASPVLVRQAPEENLGFFASAKRFAMSFSQSNPQPAQVQTGLYIFHRDGTIDVLDPDNNLTLIRKLSLRESISQAKGIVNTPALVMDQDVDVYQPQFIIQQANELMGVNVPAVIEAPQPSVMESFSQWFSSSSEPVVRSEMAGQQTQSTPEELKVVWREGI
ncbi:hypothetical protein L1077_09790 [Pseudoalteromonas luteoviolacea]|uniref:hypothetical protein n=1 Tax=Pseudoalteromonas luteoviolacea TaxID=43657 RepID=UPI001F33752C|nr:hypothetical protein [Pseudoalteromonas luteoviolacea]MCF6439721.1 hypothetical protein [Pseudoalteromonas luteoviolacea]